MGFKIHNGVCADCGKPGLIVVKRGACQYCNHKQKQAKKKAAGKSTIKYKYKEPTGEGEVFLDILDDISDMEATKCFVCGIRIAVITHNNFAHVLPKGKYEDFRLYKENIKILCHSLVARIDPVTGKPTNGCHFDWDTKPRSELMDDVRWEAMIKLEEELKLEYKNRNK